MFEVDQDRRRLIFSDREAQREWRAQQKARLLNELHEAMSSRARSPACAILARSSTSVARTG